MTRTAPEPTNMWDDGVFASRQKELHNLSANFTSVLDQMLVDRPIELDSRLLRSLEEEEEEEEECAEEEESIETRVHEQALLVMYEIDRMRTDAHKLVTWFRPAVCRNNARLKSMRQGVERLHAFLETLRIRAENLLA